LPTSAFRVLVLSIPTLVTRARFDILGMSSNNVHIVPRQLPDAPEKDVAIGHDFQYKTLRHDFHIPTNGGVGATETDDPLRECIYLCGNSLGLQPKDTKTLIHSELDIWATRGVQGHFRHDQWPWVAIHESCTPGMAQIVGAKVDEIAIMGSLTANLHLLMAAFYAPTAERHKVIIEDKAFPSDHVS
jgi:kynureninase